jgi:hypothetical protein
MRYLLILLLAWQYAGLVTKAQSPTPTAVEAVISVDNESPQLGEVFTLTLTAVVPKAFQLKGWVKLPVRTFPLVIREQGELSITETPDYLTYTQTFRAVLWNTGLYVTPPLWLTYADALGDQQHPFNSVSLTVPSLLVDEVSPTLRPSFSPQALPYLSPLLPLGLTFALLSALGALWYVRQRRKTATGRESTPIQLAKAQLEDVIHNNHEPSLSYALISQILREYVTAVFRVAATEMTTQELVDTLQTVEKIPRPLLHGLESLLSQADLVKFARFEAQTPTQYASQVLRWLQTVDVQHAHKDETQ